MTNDICLRTSERTMFNRCRFQHSLAYTERYKPKVEAPALRFGTLIHAALETYYTPRPKSKTKRIQPAILFETYYHEEVARTMREWPQWRDEENKWHEYLELGIAMLNGYVERWNAQDDEYVTLSTEQTFQLPINHPSRNEPLYPTKDAPSIYVGTFDRILYHRPTKRLLLGDYKTTASDPTKVSHLIMDEQASAYWVMAPLWLRTSAPATLQAKIARRLRALPPSVRRAVVDDDGHLRFDGILYDFLKKSLPDERPVNAEGQRLNKDKSVSKVQPTPLFHRETVYRNEPEREQIMNRIWTDAAEIGYVRNGQMALKKSPDLFHCLSADTRILTDGGILSLSDAAEMDSLSVVDRYGEWAEARVMSFGVQKLYKVLLSDGNVIRATAEHRWWAMSGTQQTDERITTLELERVPLAKASVTNMENEGIRHGFVYGDGYIKNGKGCAYFQHPHKTCMEDYFDNTRIRRNNENRSRIEGLPAHYKSLPELTTPEYARGFIAGLFAADGTVGRQGECMIWCEGRDVALSISEVARLGGCVISSVKLESDKPTNYSPPGTTSRQLMRIQIKPATVPLIRQDQMSRIKSTHQMRSMYRDVVSITEDCSEEVFCAVVPGSESFVLANGVATSNCRMCAYKDICELHEIGADWQNVAKATMTTWSPYDSHIVKDEAHGDRT
jgi:hypothetical protein